MIINFCEFEIRSYWTYVDTGGFVYFAWENFKLIRSSDAFAHKHLLYKHALLKGDHGIEIHRDEFCDLLAGPRSGLKPFFEKEDNAYVRCPYQCVDDPDDIENYCGECGGMGAVRKRMYTHQREWDRRNT